MDTEKCIRCCYYERCTRLGRTANKECINRSKGKTIMATVYGSMITNAHVVEEEKIND